MPPGDVCIFTRAIICGLWNDQSPASIQIPASSGVTGLPMLSLVSCSQAMKKTRHLLIPPFVLATAVVLRIPSASPQSIPTSVTGTWRIVRQLTAPIPACWDDTHLKGLVGSTLRYQSGAMAWQGGKIATPEALSRTLSRRKFVDEYKQDLTSLGIHAEEITEIDLQHEDADITGATTEVPGDTILLAGPGRILVSACGAFYEAVRPGPRAPR